MDADLILDRRRLRRRATFWRVFAFILLAALIVGLFLVATDVGVDRAALRAQVARVEVSGFIASRPAAVRAIERAADSGTVRAIILRIDSPGGAATGGEALYRAIRDAAAKKPVVAVIDGVGTSAAYMAAIAADHVVARESTITGSIGVMFQFAHIGELLDKIGAQYEEVRSAPLKGEPSIFREPSPEALEMLQELVDDSFEWFVSLVAERRDFSPAEARRVADGRVFTGRRALELRLVDRIGSEDEAREWLQAEHGVSTDLPVVEWRERDGWLSPFASEALAGLARLLGLRPGEVEALKELLPKRLTVDGLLSVWHPRLSVQPDR